MSDEIVRSNDEPVDTDTDVDEADTDNDSSTSSRQRSTIKFPYGDLDDAISVAKAVHDQYGGNCTDDQLADALGQTTTSGAFRQKVATAQTFGVVERERGGVLTITNLGLRIIDEPTESEARVEAFLAVPLYQAIFENHQGSRLPSDPGLEKEMAALGVSPKQTARARQAFQRSAEAANMLGQGADRLVIPPQRVSVNQPPKETPPTEAKETASTPARASSGITLRGVVDHPLIVGLWAMLPQPNDGTFPPSKQKQWLEAARVNLALLYGSEDPQSPQTSAVSGPSDSDMPF